MTVETFKCSQCGKEFPINTSTYLYVDKTRICEECFKNIYKADTYHIDAKQNKLLSLST